MKTDLLTPKDLFQKNVRYTVPMFQRRYVWTQDDQWEPLWEDVRNIAEDYLEKLEASSGNEVRAEENTVEHFLGAVVIQQVSTATKDLEQREVIDGQQRLTTLQLLLDAVQFVYEFLELKQVAKRLSKLVVNDEDLVEDADHVFKLWPTKSDREAFRHAMQNGLATHNYEQFNIVQAHEYFQLQSRQWLELVGDSVSTRAEALEVALSKKLQIVVIDLSVDDNPHVIFETLNARGTPLLESDLVKNFVTSQVGGSHQLDIWGDLDDDWWRKDLRQGRLLRPRIDALLDYWLEMRTADDVSAGRVFNVFQRVAADQPIEDIMLQLRGDLSSYRRYEEGPRQGVEDVFHYRADVMQMGAFTPALLSILSSPERVRFGALSALESFLIRRMICRDTTKDYNRLATELVRELQDNTSDNTYTIVVEFLRSQTAPSRRWPTDRDLDDSLISLPLYRLLTRGRLRLILEGIEAEYRGTRLSEQVDVPRNLTIEHVLPQSWESHWPLPSKVEQEAEEAHNRRNRLIHTIGNLTLVNMPLNSMASNGPWERKREALEEHSVLMLNRELLSDSAEVMWDENHIVNRSKQMAVLVAQVWPGPNAEVWTKEG